MPAPDSVMLSVVTESWLAELGLLDALAPALEYQVGVDHTLNAAGFKTTTHTAQLRSIATWVQACFDTALNIGDTEVDPKLRPDVRPRWRRFMLLLSRDPASCEAIESVARLGDLVQVTVFVLEMLKALTEKIDSSKFVQKMSYRQQIRARRIDGRSSALSDDGRLPRPNDEDFLAEALPPKVTR